jgi:hypothetical protein
METVQIEGQHSTVRPFRFYSLLHAGCRERRREWEGGGMKEDGRERRSENGREGKEESDREQRRGSERERDWRKWRGIVRFRFY